MTAQEAFWNSWFGISLSGMTVAAVLVAVGFIFLRVSRRLHASR